MWQTVRGLLTSICGVPHETEMYRIDSSRGFIDFISPLFLILILLCRLYLYLYGRD